MRRLLIGKLGFLILLIISCNENELVIHTSDKEPIDTLVELKYSDYILAGQTDSTWILYTDKKSIDTLFIRYPNKGDSIFIDINDDGIDDFQLMSSGFQSAGTKVSNHKIIPLCNNEIVGYKDTLNRTMAYSISYGVSIDMNSSWMNKLCYLYGYSYNMYSGPVNWGFFGGPEGKFIGVKTFVNDKALYGWIRVKVSDWNLILIDYATTVGYK